MKDLISNKDNPIDFVILWVDGNDKKWQESLVAEKRLAGNNGFDMSDIRFRNWENLQYWFRGVEKFAPWVNKVHFVTCGHLPEWLNTSHPKLNIVEHKDFIEDEKLPLFNSCAIEVQLHKITGLAENFVYFNDDIFILNNIKPDDFFRGGVPCDVALLNAQGYGGVLLGEAGTNILNSVGIINKAFNKRETIKKHFTKWINFKYGLGLFRTLLLLPWNTFTGFKDHHGPQPFLKSTFNTVWKKYTDILTSTSKSKFRGDSDVNQYVFRYWQLVSGQFSPKRQSQMSRYFAVDDSNVAAISQYIAKTRDCMACFNDGDITDFETAKKLLIQGFEQRFPKKSAFEK